MSLQPSVTNILEQVKIHYFLRSERLNILLYDGNFFVTFVVIVGFGPGVAIASNFVNFTERHVQ